MKKFKNIGYIYKITNLVNGKVYIGQTIKKVERRWREHINSSKEENSNYYNYPLYKAFRKYGLNNFKFEVIEECEIDKLNEKEIFYIKKFNSYRKGYNQTLGGDGHRLIDIPNEEIINCYLELKTIGKVSKKLKIRTDYVSKVLNDNNIAIISVKEHAQEKGYEIRRYSLDGELLESYNCMMDAARWIYNEGLSSLQPMSIRMSLKHNLLTGCSYLGYIWETDSYSLERKEKILKKEKENKRKYNKLNPKPYKPRPPKEPKSKKPRMKKEYFCSYCGAKIQRGAKICVDCYKKEQAKNIPPRDTLKQEIRTTSFLQIGKKYGVSDSAIRKWCKKYNLPFKSSEIKSYSDEEWKNI